VHGQWLLHSPDLLVKGSRAETVYVHTAGDASQKLVFLFGKRHAVFVHNAHIDGPLARVSLGLSCTCLVLVQPHRYMWCYSGCIVFAVQPSVSHVHMCMLVSSCRMLITCNTCEEVADTHCSSSDTTQEVPQTRCVLCTSPAETVIQ
jgi:hypothetical protein